MKILDAWRAIAVMAAAGMLAIGWSRDVAFDPASSLLAATIQEGQGPPAGTLRPFHSEIIWQLLEQAPVPEGRCTEPVPAGLAYLWLSKIPGTATTTHLGRGPYYAELCIYGLLTNPGAPPPGNGTPMGWYADVQFWTAANGDQLKGTGGLIGFTAPPGTPGFKFIESLSFLDGGTGRFEYAEGTGTGFVDPVAQTAVYDGWIRYGKKEK